MKLELLPRPPVGLPDRVQTSQLDQFGGEEGIRPHPLVSQEAPHNPGQHVGIVVALLEHGGSNFPLKGAHYRMGRCLRKGTGQGVHPVKDGRKGPIVTVEG